MFVLESYESRDVVARCVPVSTLPVLAYYSDLNDLNWRANLGRCYITETDLYVIMYGVYLLYYH